jgi:hypothetical protein
VQFAEVVSVLAQWARPSAEIRLNAHRFHTGVQKDMKFAHHLLLKRLSSFLILGIAQSADYQLVAIRTIRLVQL